MKSLNSSNVRLITVINRSPKIHATSGSMEKRWAIYGYLGEQSILHRKKQWLPAVLHTYPMYMRIFSLYQKTKKKIYIYILDEIEIAVLVLCLIGLLSAGSYSGNLAISEDTHTHFSFVLRGKIFSIFVPPIVGKLLIHIFSLFFYMG